MDKEKAIVLLSGGIDSTTCLALAVKEYGAENVTALCIHYGQKHARELDASVRVADFYGVKYERHDLREVFKSSECTLLEGRDQIPEGSYAEQQEEQGTKIVSTYVPFRNGLFLSYAASIAFARGIKWVYYGAHMDDAVGGAYPDCTKTFVRHMRKAIDEGTGSRVILAAPFICVDKATVVRVGLHEHAPYHLTWSCYEGGYRPCGKCGTCIDRAKAFEANGVEDPAMYGPPMEG